MAYQKANNDIGDQSLLSMVDQASNTATNPMSMLQNSSDTGDIMGAYDMAASSTNQKQPSGSQFSSSKESKDDSIDIKKIAEVAVCLL